VADAGGGEGGGGEAGEGGGGVGTVVYKSRDRGEKRTLKCCRYACVTSIW